MQARRIGFCCTLLILSGFLKAASAQVVISGVVNGYDGKPMPKDRFAMPWLHAIDPDLRELQSPMDASGTIIASDEECAGRGLRNL